MRLRGSHDVLARMLEEIPLGMKIDPQMADSITSLSLTVLAPHTNQMDSCRVTPQQMLMVTLPNLRKLNMILPGGSYLTPLNIIRAPRLARLHVDVAKMRDSLFEDLHGFVSFPFLSVNAWSAALISLACYVYMKFVRNPPVTDIHFGGLAEMVCEMLDAFGLFNGNDNGQDRDSDSQVTTRSVPLAPANMAGTFTSLALAIVDGVKRPYMDPTRWHEELELQSIARNLVTRILPHRLGCIESDADAEQQARSTGEISLRKVQIRLSQNMRTTCEQLGLASSSLVKVIYT